ncbi:MULTISPECIES: hypothetical protein [Pseudoalteromonas]|uniref:Uncharacterized protein n=1 Tax=Pseudoalteromonas amylolytica TaxID=1859457 RepID=A0A1S1MPD9_9GAMM|nr:MULTISPECIES: hypothetical protein [Pseudoalteromonas]OHU84384.1 hypothetical protein BFC16_01725 [Pseudoalteromonas sp. JW3]OHU87077.1 hypothetical protein BET10_00215 [Pseudoalteromonas amylolytica]
MFIPKRNFNCYFFALLLLLIGGCNEERAVLNDKNAGEQEKITIELGADLVATEFDEVTLSIQVEEGDVSADNLTWTQLEGTPVSIKKSGLNATFFVPKMEFDETAKFKVDVTGIEKQSVSDEVSVHFIGSAPLFTHDFDITNYLGLGETVNIALDDLPPNTNVGWMIVNYDGSTAELVESSDSFAKIRSDTSGSFKLVITASNKQRTESSSINFYTSESWEHIIQEKASKIPDYVRANGSYKFSLDLDFEEELSFSWSIDDQVVSELSSFIHTFDQVGTSEIRLLVAKQGIQVFEKNWNIDVYKRRTLDEVDYEIDGDTISISENSLSAIRGLKLTIPDELPLTVEDIRVSEIINSKKNIKFKLEPEGASFLSPIAVTLPKPEETEIFSILHTDEEGKYGGVIPVHVNGDTITFSVNHFSNFELVSGKGSILELNELSEHNDIYADDLINSYELFAKVYNDLNKTYMAINSVGSAVTTSILLSDLYKIKSNTQALLPFITNQRLSALIDTVSRPDSYWKDKSRVANYGSLQHKAKLKRAKALISALTEYEKVLKALPKGVRLSDVEVGKVKEVRSALQKVDNYIGPLFIAIDTAFSIWHLNEGDAWASLKSSVNAFSNAFSISLAKGVKIVKGGRLGLSLAKGPKHPHLVAAIESAHLIENFVLDPLIYEPTTNFIDYISDTAMPELDSFHEITRNEFIRVMQYARANNNSDAIENFTDLRGLSEAFKSRLDMVREQSDEIRTEVNARYKDVLWKNMMINIAYTSFLDSYVNSYDLAEWQVERIQREVSRARANVEEVSKAREAIIASMKASADIQFSILELLVEERHGQVFIKWSAEGFSKYLELHIKSAGKSIPVAVLANQSGDFSYDFNLRDFRGKLSGNTELTISLVALNESGNIVSSRDSDLKLPATFWVNSNVIPSLYSGDENSSAVLRINDFLKNSLKTSTVSSEFENVSLEINAFKELNAFRAIDLDSDFISISQFESSSTGDRDEYLMNGIYYRASECTVARANNVDSYNEQMCIGDTKGSNPALVFQFGTNGEQQYGRMCQESNPFMHVRDGFCSDCAPFYPANSFGASNAIKYLSDWRVIDGNPVQMSEHRVNLGGATVVEYDLPIQFGIAPPKFIDDTSGQKFSDRNGNQAIKFEYEITGYENYVDGEYYLFTITLSDCDSFVAGKKVDGLSNRVDFFSILGPSLPSEKIRQTGVEVIKVIAKNTPAGLEMLGYASNTLNSSCFSIDYNDLQDSPPICIPDDTGPDN